MGTTESALPLPAWEDVVAASPVLTTLEPDVEAVLVRRTRGARDYWICPVDECYRLAGAMRMTWEGISGGDRMRDTVDAFFRRLSTRAPRPPRVRSGVADRVAPNIDGADVCDTNDDQRQELEVSCRTT
jgi:hypothetical protein